MVTTRRRLAVVEGRSGDHPAAPVATSLDLLARVAAAGAGIIGAIAVVGWTVGSIRLERVFPFAAAMHFDSAVSIVLLAATLFVPSIVRVALSAIVALICVLALVEQITTLSIGIDHVVGNAVRDPHSAASSSVNAAGLLLLAVAQLLFAGQRPLRAQNCALPVAVGGYLLLLGYFYDASRLTRAETTAHVILATNAATFLLALAALAAVPGGSLSWASTSQDAGARLVRRLLPLAILGLPVLGYLAVMGEHHGLYAGSAAAVLIVISGAAAVGVATWTAARGLSRMDKRRAQAIAELTDLRIDLERQVQERATQLQRRHNEIAVLEDRQRIAADLHDIVIQRLFAAGMYLQSGADGLDGETRRRLDSAVEAMDVAIKDLRASIFELGGWVRQRIDMTTAVSDVCTESARILGFEPDVLIDDPDDDSDRYREDVLAVLREALANVARHAEATAANVVLRVRDEFIWLSVTDNGKGMSENSRRSGTRNMAQRAREHGGDCTWNRVDPSGTQVLWCVPVLEPVG